MATKRGRTAPVYRLIPFIDVGGQSDLLAVAEDYEERAADALFVSGPGAAVEPALAALTAAVALPLLVRSDSASVGSLGALASSGASRLFLDAAALADPDLITEAAGACAPADLGVEVHAARDGEAWRVARPDGKPTEWDPITWTRVVEAQGASEVILRAAGRGDDEPFDLELFAEVASAVAIPVIAGGRSSRHEDYLDVLMIGGAAGVILEASGARRMGALRSYLDEHGLEARS